MTGLSRRRLLQALPVATLAGRRQRAAAQPERVTLLVSNSAGDAVSFVDPAGGDIDAVTVGAAPWGIALAPGDRAYVATAEGVAIVDTARRERLALVPYEAAIGEPQFGEYRPGGMGIAAGPDGRFAYVGVYLADGPSRLEVLDVEAGAIGGGAPIGVRPFQVLVAADGAEVYAIDHDSFTVTAVDAADLTTRTLPAAPLGTAGFDKPHYGALLPSGRLLLPYQGRVLLELDPATGQSTTRPLSADTHQHGVALTDDGRLLIVGVGPAGSAVGPPSLTVLDLASGDERLLPLARLHEAVAIAPDGRAAYLSGGYTFADGGWDGISVVDLASGDVREIAVPDRPLAVAVLP